jgi:hypothetical protein
MYSTIDQTENISNSNGNELNNNNMEKLRICPRLDNEFLDEFGNTIGEDEDAKDKNIRKSKIINQEFTLNNISHQEYVLDGIQKEYYKM